MLDYFVVILRSFDDVEYVLQPRTTAAFYGDLQAECLHIISDGVLLHFGSCLLSDVDRICRDCRLGSAYQRDLRAIGVPIQEIGFGRVLA